MPGRVPGIFVLPHHAGQAERPVAPLVLLARAARTRVVAADVLAEHIGQRRQPAQIGVAGTLDDRDRRVLSEAGFPVWGEDMAH
jgi:hypothetical protein